MRKCFQLLVFAVSLCFLLPQPSHGTGTDNPTGVTGEYNGSLDTGVDPYTGNGKRFVTDLTVTGSLGAYPLKWTRVLNTRYGGGPNHSYNWGLWLRPYRQWEYFPDPYEGPDGVVTYPDGRRMELDVDETNTYYPVSGPEPADRIEPVGGGNYDLILADGGRVEFRINGPPPPTQIYTLTATRIIDPHGLVTLLERDGSHRLWKITEPGGRYLEITYHTYYDWVPWPSPGGTQASTVISKVEAFARPDQLIEQVEYIYAEEYVQGFTYRKLAHVNYADGAQATYTYFPNSPMLPPLFTVPSYSGRMKTCDDPRVPGPMGKIEYDYLTVAENYNRPVGGGQVQRVKYPGSSTYISEVIYPEDIPYSAEPAEFERKEKRPNGTTRSFQYSNSGTPELLSYTDFKGQPTYIGWPYIPGSTTYRRTLTDERGKTSSVDKEYWIGAVKKVTNAEGKEVTFEYTDNANPHYLLSKTDERGKITSYERYPADHPNRHMIKRINYPDTGWESFVYNNFGQVIEHRMTRGGTELFTYDTRGLKETYTPPDTSSDGSPELNPTVYTYYYGNEEGRTDRADRLKSVRDPLGNITTYDYDIAGRVTVVKYHDTKYTENRYNHDGTLEWSEDELRHRTSYRYDEFKRVIEVKNHLGQYTTSSYDPGNGLGALSHTTSSVYRTTSFMGKVTEYGYDENFQRIATTQAPGTTNDEATTTSTYDPAGNLETVTQPNSQPGPPHGGAHTLTQYDDCNRRKSVTDALHHKTEWEYDDAGNMEKETRPDLKFRTWDLYDDLNRIKHTTGFLNEPTTYAYDLAGNLTLMTDSKGAQYISVYDELNRKVSATYPVDANNEIRTETWLYDIAGNLKVYKNPAGKFRHFLYDVRNRPRRAYWSNSAGGSPDQSVGPDIETTLDDASRVIEIKTNGNQTVVAFGYDEANRKIWEDQTVGGFTRRVNTDPDLDGNRATLSVAGVYALTYDYTQRQQLWHIKTGGNQFFEYSYDKNGNLKKRHNQFQGADSTTFEYDALNRVTRGEQFQKNGVSFAQSNYNEYDLLNNLKSISRVEDGNKGERFEYDDASQLKKASYKVAIGPPPSPTPPPTPPPAQTPTPPPGQTPTPPPGQSPTPPPGPGTPTPPPPPTATPPPGQVAQVEMWNTDEFGETWYVTMTTGTSGATIFYKIGQNGFIDPTHNAAGQATNGTSVYTGAPIPVPVGNPPIHFRAVAYRAGMIDSVMTDLSVDNVENGGNAPAAGQRTVFYSNDPLNRTSMIDNGTQTVYGPTSGVNQYMSVSGHTLAYDANFNLSGYDAWSYVYDAEKRLISASGSGTAMGQGHSAQFVYDGLGRCVKRTIDNVTTLITYDGWKPIAEWNGAGNLVAWNLYGPGADEILVRYDVGATKHVYYHLDAHGHVQFLLDANGDVLDKYTYDAFGQPKITGADGGERTTTSNGNRFLFTGREYLSALGLYDYRHRVYHPGLGRFLQIDPLGLHIEGAKLSAQQTALYVGGTAPGTFSSSELNLYRYCQNDPINNNDPFGLEFTPAGEARVVHDLRDPDGLVVNGLTGPYRVTSLVAIVPGDNGTFSLQVAQFDVTVEGKRVAQTTNGRTRSPYAIKQSKTHENLHEKKAEDDHNANQNKLIKTGLTKSQAEKQRPIEQQKLIDRYRANREQEQRDCKKGQGAWKAIVEEEKKK